MIDANWWADTNDRKEKKRKKITLRSEPLDLLASESIECSMCGKLAIERIVEYRKNERRNTREFRCITHKRSM